MIAIPDCKSPHRPPRGAQLPAFTLIEMLVVIAIILLLVSLLIPGLQVVERRIAVVKCANNMRQIYTACIVYAGDSNGYFPRFPIASQNSNCANCPHCSWALDANGWANPDCGSLWPYLRGGPNNRMSVLQCPADDFVEKTTWGNPRNFSYSTNFKITPSNLAAPTAKLVHVVSVAKRIMILDERRPNDGWFVWPFDNDDEGTTRHSGKGNYVLFDGHIEQFVPDDVWGNAVINLDTAK